jgi:RNA polymerase sigma-70 factor (ECF subfamily)
MVAIATLPELQREALVAVDLVGLSYGQAARALNTTGEAIASRLFRARVHVARSLDELTIAVRR